MSLISVCFAPQILHAMKMPSENLADALTYMRITCGTMLIAAGYNTISSILRALGDSKTPLYFIVVSSVINILLDILFVTKFYFGVAGVAWATVIAQVFSFGGSLALAIIKNPYFRLKREHFRPSRFIVKKMCNMGIPLAVQNAMYSITGVVSQSVVNSFGSTVMSAYTAAGRMEQLVWQPYGTLGLALSTFAGQNMGAGKYDRIKQGCRKCVYFALGFAVLMIAVMFGFGKTLMTLFVEDEGVIAIGATGLIISSFSYFFVGLVYIYKATLNGIGDAGFTMWSGITEVAARIFGVMVLTLIPAIGYWGIWMTGIFTSLISSVMCICRFRRGKWKTKGI